MSLSFRVLVGISVMSGPELLAEARAIFPATAFPDHWTTTAGPLG
jgi:hypothetical protein